MGRRAAAVAGIAEWKPLRVWDRPMFMLEACAELAAQALEDAGLAKDEVDGLLIPPLSDSPMFGPSAAAEYLGIPANFGEVVDRRTRAELLDEGLEIVTRLWAAEQFEHRGTHYRVDSKIVNPPPPAAQRPRVPIWVVGAWPHERSMRRALAYDGLIPSARDPGEQFRQATPDEVREMKAWIDARRTAGGPFDIVVEGETPAGDPEAARQAVGLYRDAGATWWIEAQWSLSNLDELAARARGGPPRID